MKIFSTFTQMNKQKFTTATMLCLLIIMVIIAFIIAPNNLEGNNAFLSMTNLNNVIAQSALLIISGFAVTLLLITGNLDLSIGSILAMAGVIYGVLARDGMLTGYAVLLALVASMLMGALNAVLILGIKINSAIVTLGTMSIARGLAKVLADGSSIGAGLPRDFENIGATQIVGIKLPNLIMIILVIIFTVIQNKTVFGKQIIYLGSNKSTAELSGIKTVKVMGILYIISGLLSGLCGIIIASRMRLADSGVGTEYAFDAIIAAVIGGTALEGGAGSINGMVIGAFIIGIINNILNLLGVLPWWQFVAKGIVIILAILFQRNIYRIADKMLNRVEKKLR